MSEDFSLSLEQDAQDAATELSILTLDLEEARLEFGVLFENGVVDSGFKNSSIARAFGDLVIASGQRSEAELMRRDGTDWVSVRTGEDAATVAARRWGTGK